MSRKRAPSSFVIMSTAFHLAASAVAASAFWPIYQAPQFVLMAAVTIIAGSAIALVGARLRWPGLAMVGATVAAYLILGVPLAIPGSALFGVLPSGEGLLELLRSAALGWRQILTIALPVGSYQSLLVPSFLIILVTTIIGLSIALRSNAGELSVLPPTLTIVLGLAFGPRDAPQAVPLVLLYLGLVMTWLSWHRWHRRREGVRAIAVSEQATTGRIERAAGLRAGASALAILIVAIAIGGASSAAAPLERDRAVFRDVVQQPFDPRSYPSPLGAFRRFLQPALADTPMFNVTGLPVGSRVRLATLDTYDGVVFSVGSEHVTSDSGSFTRVATSIDRRAENGEALEVDFDISGYDGIWLPTVGRLSSVDFGGAAALELGDSFFFNETGLAGVTLAGLEAGDRYTLQTVIPLAPASGSLSTLTPGDAQVPPAEVVPEELTVVLDGWVRGAEAPGDRLELMLTSLADEGYVSHGVAADEPPSRSGHGADRIQELVTAPRMIGDEEQYAVAAALMARAIGFPSRVVFGFAPERGGPSTTVVFGRDVSAWIEVHTAQFGWVTIDPTPPDREIPDEEPEEPTEVARPQSPVPPPAVEPDPRRDQIPLDAGQEDEEQDDPFLAALLAALTVLAWIGGILLVLLAPFIAIVVAKARRRYLRERSGSPSARVSGGWREFEDMLADYGYSAPPSPTRSEVAEALGGVRPLVLASVADRAVFAPEHVDEDESRQVWAAVRELEGEIAARRTRWQRLRAALSLRSLAGDSLRGLFSRERRHT